MLKILLLSSSLLLTGSAYAQVGVRAGGNITGLATPQQASSPTTETNSHVGYQVGLYYQVALTKRLSLVPEVQFSRESQQVFTSNSDYLDGGFHSDHELRLSYLNVPVLLRAAVGPLYVEAGPQASLLVGGYGRGTLLGSGFYPYSRPIDQAARERYRELDAGVSVGIGAKLPAGLGLSLRVYRGLVPIDQPSSSSDTPIPQTGNKVYRQTAQASLTYQLAAH